MKQIECVIGGLIIGLYFGTVVGIALGVLKGVIIGGALYIVCSLILLILSMSKQPNVM